MQEAVLEPSRKCQGMQTIPVLEVLLGLECAGGLWHTGEEIWENAWVGLSGGTLCPELPSSLPSTSTCPRSLQHNPRDKMNIPQWQGTL